MTVPKLNTTQILEMECALSDCQTEWKWLLKVKEDKVLVPLCEPHFKAYWEESLPEGGRLEVIKFE